MEDILDYAKNYKSIVAASKSPNGKFKVDDKYLAGTSIEDQIASTEHIKDELGCSPAYAALINRTKYLNSNLNGNGSATPCFDVVSNKDRTQLLREFEGTEPQKYLTLVKDYLSFFNGSKESTLQEAFDYIMQHDEFQINPNEKSNYISRLVEEGKEVIAIFDEKKAQLRDDYEQKSQEIVSHYGARMDDTEKAISHKVHQLEDIANRLQVLSDVGTVAALPMPEIYREFGQGSDKKNLGGSETKALALLDKNDASKETKLQVVLSYHNRFLDRAESAKERIEDLELKLSEFTREKDRELTSLKRDYESSLKLLDIELRSELRNTRGKLNQELASDNFSISIEGLKQSSASAYHTLSKTGRSAALAIGLTLMATALGVGYNNLSFKSVVADQRQTTTQLLEDSVALKTELNEQVSLRKKDAAQMGVVAKQAADKAALEASKTAEERTKAVMATVSAQYKRQIDVLAKQYQDALKEASAAALRGDSSAESQYMNQAETVRNKVNRSGYKTEFERLVEQFSIDGDK